MSPSLESTKHDVLQLLWEYQTWHAAFGGARPWDEQHVAQAAYGPAGRIFEGAAYYEYEPRQREQLAQSYEALDRGLKLMETGGPLEREAYAVLHNAYLKDEADPSVVERWREWEEEWERTRQRLEREDEEAFAEWMTHRPVPETLRWRQGKPPLKTLRWLRTHYKPQNAAWVDLGVWQLAFYLQNTKLYPIEPKRLSESEDKSIENRNAEIYADFQRLRASGMTERGAAREAAKIPGVSVEYVESLVEFRDTIKPRVCIEEGCDKSVYSQNRCSRHYQQSLKRRKALKRE